jgi:hypothetical protein
MHNGVNYTLASPQLQIYAKATAVIYVHGPSLDIAPDNPSSISLDRIVHLAVYGKPGIHYYIAANSVGRSHKSGTPSSDIHLAE